MRVGIFIPERNDEISSSNLVKVDLGSLKLSFIFQLKFHLEEKIVMHLRFDILVMSHSSVVLYLELGQSVRPQEVDQSIGILASLTVQISTLQVDVEETPEVVDLLNVDVDKQC